jgi:hypothetical protein
VKRGRKRKKRLSATQIAMLQRDPCVVCNAPSTMALLAWKGAPRAIYPPRRRGFCSPSCIQSWLNVFGAKAPADEGKRVTVHIR